MTHKYSVDQMVELRSAPGLSNRPSGNCRILALLPKERGPVQYRVQSMLETIQRVVNEDDLRPAHEQARPIQEEVTEVFSVAIKRR